jgi:TRAP-type C4-dicarboxylate transport system permease small subunit
MLRPSGGSMTEKLRQSIEHILRAVRGLAVTLLACSIALNFCNILGRYFLARSITWAEEIMLFLMVGCVFFGAATPAWAGRHIRMDVFLRMAPQKVRDALHLSSDIALVLTSVVLVIFALPTVVQLEEFDQRSMAANIPLVIPQAAIPIGLGLMAVLGLARIVLGLWRHPADSQPTH